ncbi:phytoene desaturase family protein [bacterium]|jgi:phytoene desaturase|nr:phytoene desaturase [Euryarchaeota archaeon]MDA8790252.1 phytoene desaturase family protein [bacterium]MDA9964138.1 phytoene desaturase family protein [bacterium]MDB2397747.1 phytoene desaturase family protein [Candidatus Poseidoniales archaeon]MDC0528314.1 phytoene desaturase family protein [Candidatus Poseidoniaceae archaeon]
MSNTNAPTAIIVGSGPGGLASALLLAHSGVNVTVLEKAEAVGGRTRLFKKDGYTFDRGPTFFHYPEVIEEIFKAIGRDAHKELGLMPLDPMYRLVFGAGGHIDATSNLDQMTERIRELAGDKNANGFKNYVKQNRKKLDLSKQCLQTPWSSPLDVFSKRAIRVATVLKPWASVAGDLSKHFDDERVRLAMSFQTKYLGMSPFHAPSLFTILAFLEYEHGIFHAKGGLGSITARMGEIAEEMGVDIRLNTPVKSLIYEGKTVTGVRIDGSEMLADKVVINADFAHAMTTLVPDEKRKKWSNKKLEKKGYSCSTFMLYLGVDKEYDLPHHQIYASSEYENNLKDITQHRLTWDDPSVYVQNASITDDSLAPDGHSTIYVLVPVPNQHESIVWDDIKGDFRETIVKQLSKLGYDGIEDHIVSETIITPDDWGASDIYRGAVFNLTHDLKQMLWRRPHNRFEEANNLYIVGGGTHPGSGLPTIFESARISSKLVLADLGMRPDWNGVDSWFKDVKRPKVAARPTAQPKARGTNNGEGHAA